mgnify:CR=1 FL=1
MTEKRKDFGTQCLRGAGQVFFMENALTGALIITFLSFPMVSSLAFRAFDCEEFDGGRKFMRADYSIDCDSPEHFTTQLIAGLMIVIYPIGTPLLYYCLLRRNKDRIDRLQVGRRRRVLPVLWYHVTDNSLVSALGTLSYGHGGG